MTRRTDSRAHAMTSPVTLSRPALAPHGVVARTTTSKSRACAFGSLPRSLERRRAALRVTTSTPLRRRFSVAASASASPQVSAELAAKATKAATATTSAASTMPASLGAALASSFAFPALWAFAAVPCCLAFLNPVYVFSVGYGLSVAAQAAGMKHVARRHFFVRDMVESFELTVPFVRTDDNIADFFTKPLSATKFHMMRKRIMNEP